ncbi:FMN-binding protein [Paenibacillus sp. GCM10027628]|uniref:FMN-binding protein n=1 Tax=Paenibacillus sp. GCM10027628 TaxID=3273413 RepID=UPI003625A5A4
MNKKWVILCTTAIGAIYTAGYFATETQATQATIQQPSPYSQSQVNIQANSTPSKGQYKNGTFYGLGSNRRGSIQVAVTMKNDKITDVEISHFAMHYSEDDVVGLPQEVVQKQSAQVRNVSGATYSTEAFQDAVQDALSQARNS